MRTLSFNRWYNPHHLHVGSVHRTRKLYLSQYGALLAPHNLSVIGHSYVARIISNKSFTSQALHAKTFYEQFDATSFHIKETNYEGIY